MKRNNKRNLLAWLVFIFATLYSAHQSYGVSLTLEFWIFVPFWIISIVLTATIIVLNLYESGEPITETDLAGSRYVKIVTVLSGIILLVFRFPYPSLVMMGALAGNLLGLAFANEICGSFLQRRGEYIRNLPERSKKYIRDHATYFLEGSTQEEEFSRLLLSNEPSRELLELPPRALTGILPAISKIERFFEKLRRTNA